MKNYISVLFYITLFLSCFFTAQSEVYTSIKELEDLLNTGGEIVKTIDNYLESEEKRLKHVRWLNSEYQKLYEAAAQDVQMFVSNPLHAYLLVKRLSADWRTTEVLADNPFSRDIIYNLTRSGLLKFPDAEDLVGAATAVMRLQDTYLLNTTDLARGKIEGTTTFSQLSAGDCFELGYQAFNSQFFKHAVKWLEEALKRTDSETEIPTTTKDAVLEHLAYAYYMERDVEKAIKYTKDLIELQPYSAKAQVNLKFYEDYLKSGQAARKGDAGEEKTKVVGEQEDEPFRDHFDNYHRLCRGERLKTPEEESKLFCQYVTNNNSYLFLQPVKEEVVNLDPKIVVYYDVINDRIADSLKELSVPKLSRATVQNPYSAQLEFATYRVSKSAWLYDGEDETVLKSSEMIEEVTGLETDTSELLHVINYGIGGHYMPHYDFRREGEADGFKFLGTGNRIATWIYYLSDVEAGGATVFPTIGVSLKPIKGSAAFWYNLKRSGEGDLDTLHAACPVLAGVKWIANKWLHEHDQEFRRPCGLSRLE